jgi:hypothetical protein
MFSNYLEFLTMDKVQKPSDSECYTPSSEPFIIYSYIIGITLRFEYKGKVNAEEIVLKDRYWIDLVYDKNHGK